MPNRVYWLTDDCFEALLEDARRDRRDPKRQLQVIVENHLLGVGLLVRDETGRPVLPKGEEGEE